MNKRKVVDEAPASAPPSKRVKHTAEPPAPISRATVPQRAQAETKPAAKQRVEESSSEDSSSESETSSSSSSDSSSSDSDSDSSSDESSSSSSSAPSVQTSKAPVRTQEKLKAQAKSEKSAPSGHHVPPGQGKPSTQNRNARRRRKKMYERLATSAEPASANDVPLGERRAPVQERPASATPAQQQQAPAPAAPTFMMASLSNKNKRKGFKQAMAGMLPEKIVFSTGVAGAEEAEEAPLPFTNTPAVEMTATAPNMFPRLVPPSEKAEKGQIPANMFVTSIDVEEGMHKGKKNNKKKKAEKQEKRVAEANVADETAEVENIVLDYGYPEGHISTQRDVPAPAASHPEGDWRHVEKNWANLSKLTAETQLQPGTLVGWKALGINPMTFTPEFMLNVGRVVRVGENLTVQPVHKPGAVEVSFGGYAEDEAEVALLEEESYEWNEVYSGDWKVV